MRKFLILFLTLVVGLGVAFFWSRNRLGYDAECGNVPAIEKALRNGFPVNQPLGFGRGTLLELATLNQHPDLVGVLLERGADPKITDGKGFTVFDDLESCIRRSGSGREEMIVKARGEGVSDAQIAEQFPARDLDGRDFTDRGREIWESIQQMIRNRSDLPGAR